MIGGRTMITVVATALLIAGCSSDDGGGNANDVGSPNPAPTAAAGPGSSAPTTIAATGSSPTATVAADGEPPALPEQLASAAGGNADDARLLAYLYLNLNVTTSEEAQWLLSASGSQSAIAECMSEQGFTYTPVPPQLGPQDALSPEEYAAKYGFGVAAARLGMFPPSEDPNLAYSLTLSASERAAYDTASRACTDSAPPVNPEARLQDGAAPAMAVAVEQFRGTVTNDERVVTATATWSDCIAESGYAFDGPDAMRASLLSRVEELDDDQMQALLDEEIMVATANLPCEAAYRETFREVVVDRFDEYKTLYQTALTSGAAPAANG